MFCLRWCLDLVVGGVNCLIYFGLRRCCLLLLMFVVRCYLFFNLLISDLLFAFVLFVSGVLLVVCL